MRSKTSSFFFASTILGRLPGLFHGFGARGFDVHSLKGHERGRPSRLVVLDQVHSDTVRFFSRPPLRRQRGDALATDRPGLLLAVRTADCLPLLLADPDRRAVAAVHCGWRGTAARLAEKTVLAMRKRYGSRPAALRAALGPCIGARCYEVGADVRRAFARAELPVDVFKAVRGRPGKYLLDLGAAVVFQLKSAGLRGGHIDRLDLCTHCLPEMCSYRRDPHHPGRMIHFIGYSR